MLDKPLIQINQFANMGDSGLFWLQGMTTSRMNGTSFLSPAFGTRYAFSEDTTGFSDINAPFVSMTPWYPRTNANIEVLGYTGNKLISFDYNYFATASYNRGLIHTVDNSLATLSTGFVLATKNNNVLYTSDNYLGIGYKKIVTGVSATSVTVSGVDFSALGVTVGNAKKDKCYNLTKKEQYTITGLADTNSTLQFSAPATAPEIGDYIMVFIDDKFDYKVSAQFDGQPSVGSWVRQGVFWKGLGAYYFLNGNYLSKLNIDDATFDDDLKQLPYATQGYCAATNQGLICIGAEQNQKGLVLIWDGSNSGFNSIFETYKAPSAITPYKTGWLLLIGGSIYYTDGYALTPITSIPDTSAWTGSIANYSNMQVFNDKIVIGCKTSNQNRLLTGLYIYDFKYGWSYSPVQYGSKTGYCVVYSLLTYSNSGRQVILGSGATSTQAAISYPTFKMFEEDTQSVGCCARFFIKLPQKMNINKIELNLSPKIPFDNDQDNVSVTVTVNYGDGRKYFNNEHTAITGSSMTSFINTLGATRPGKVGQLVIVETGDVAGERSYITAIANAGTATETWTMSPAFSANPYDEGTFIRYNLFKAGSKTIYTNDIPDELLYDVPSLYSDKLFIEIHQSLGRFDINSINIY